MLPLVESDVRLLNLPAGRQIGISRNLLNHVAKTYSKIVVALVVEETSYFCFYATDREYVFTAGAKIGNRSA